MGLSHWQESDNASGFVYSYLECRTDAKRKNLLRKELKRKSSEFNTPGAINIALAFEAGIVRIEELDNYLIYCEILNGLKEWLGGEFDGDIKRMIKSLKRAERILMKRK